MRAMEVIVLDSFPFELDIDALFERIHMDREDEEAEQVMDLVKRLIELLGQGSV